MARKERVFLLWLIVILAAVSLVGCNLIRSNDSNKNQNSNIMSGIGGENSENLITENTTYTTIEKIKSEFIPLGIKENKYQFKPFYNVEQTTEFTFHFNSNVDPVKAITVHTDAACEENSTVYQVNDGYKTTKGVDVIVKPMKPVLATDDRKDYNNTNYWGYSSIYYLCVRYDMDSEEVEKLESPIIIPFTVKNKIATPFANANIRADGDFSVTWKPVENAKSYKVYRSFASNGRDFVDRAKYAYVGDFLEEYKILDANTTECLIDNSDSIVNGYVRTQNMKRGYIYYITAIDAQGNESFFSNPVSDLTYSEYLPSRINSKKFDAIDTFTELPETIEITSADGKTDIKYPINYYKFDSKYENLHKCTYKYKILGTKLEGLVTYYNEENNFPNEFISKFEAKTGDYIISNNEENAPVNIPTIIDDDYKDSEIDLSKKVDYPENAKIQLDSASLMRRADLEAARVIAGNGYTRSLDTIKSYVQNSNPEYVVEFHSDGTIEVKKASDKINENKTTEVEKDVNENKPQENIDVPKKIDNKNYVEEQRKSTKKQVEEANKEKVVDTQYPIVAKTPGQKYLALKLIEQEEEISLKAFPEYQNMTEVIDDLLFVWYQNPYIMGINPNEMWYDYTNQILTVKYNVSKELAKKYQMNVYNKSREIVSEIINQSMTEEEKIVAIWNYIEKNSEYNTEAYEYLKAGASDFYDKYSNSWNTYGILCEKKGVCQSYAYAFNLLANMSGVEAYMVVGTLSNTGHAWSTVKLDGKWYMVDTTNNVNIVNVPYWICKTSTEFINKIGFRMDDSFVDGTDISEFNENDDLKDWYYEKGLVAKNAKECIDVFLKYKDSLDAIPIKCIGMSDSQYTTLFDDISQEITNRGIQNEIGNDWRVSAGLGMIIFVKGE